MFTFEAPWWYVPLMYFIIFMIYGGIGILVGSLVAYGLTKRSRPEGGAPSGSRTFSFVIVGSLVGGAV
jgi:hypothetical protein